MWHLSFGSALQPQKLQPAANQVLIKVEAAVKDIARGDKKDSHGERHKFAMLRHVVRVCEEMV